MSHIQAVLFSKSHYSTQKAREWLKSNKLKPIARVRDPGKYIRYRITDPKLYKQMRTKPLAPFAKTGIKFIVGFTK